LWDGEIVPIEAILAESYDFRHIYYFGTDRRGKLESVEVEQNFLSLMESFMHNLHADIPFAGKILKKKAKELGLSRYERYLHHAIGIDRDCSRLLILQKMGTIETIAESLRDMGAWRALLLDQGGSVGARLDDGWLCPSYYFRPERLSVFIFQIITDDLEATPDL
jgi:hypothetical protein